MNELTIQWCAASESGAKKPENDDSWIVCSANAEGYQLLDEKGLFKEMNHDIIFAVSDGMGGGNAGYLASQFILEELSDLVPKTFKAAAQGFNPDYLEQLTHKIESIHAKLNQYESSHQYCKGMGATLTLAWFTPENIYIAHVGDSRLYLHRNDETQQITEDHTFAWKQLNRGEINEYQFRNHPRKSALYQVMGGGHRNVLPSVSAIPYQAGDTFLICSDGLIDGLAQKAIHYELKNNQDNMEVLNQALLTRAVENDNTDDTTLITIKVKS